MNRWETNRVDVARGFRMDGAISDRIVNRASIAMNESEVEDALRNIVEMVTTSVVTGEKRRQRLIHNIVNQNKSLHEDIKTQIINILRPIRTYRSWTKMEDVVIEKLIREKVIKKWPDWLIEVTLKLRTA